MKRIFKKAEKALDRYQKAIDANLPDSIIHVLKNRYDNIVSEIKNAGNYDNFLDHIEIY